MTFGIVGQAVRFFGQIELQRGLGNVEADVEDGGVVLTHTCVNTSRDGCRAEALKQRFEFRTMGRAKRALRRITLRAYARRDRSRARRRPPACRREGDSSLSSALQRTKWTVSKIQDAEGAEKRSVLPGRDQGQNRRRIADLRFEISQIIFTQAATTLR